MDAAMMMHTPRIAAAATMAAAMFLFSMISFCKSPGVQMSNTLKPMIAAAMPMDAKISTLPMADNSVCACREGMEADGSAAMSGDAMISSSMGIERNAFFIGGLFAMRLSSCGSAANFMNSQILELVLYAPLHRHRHRSGLAAQTHRALDESRTADWREHHQAAHFTRRNASGSRRIRSSDSTGQTAGGGLVHGGVE